MTSQPSLRFKVIKEAVEIFKQDSSMAEALKESLEMVLEDLKNLAGLNVEETIFLDSNSKKLWSELQESVREYQGAIFKIKAYFTENNPAYLDQGIEMAYLADTKLYDIYETMNKAYQDALSEIESANKIICIKCGAKNHKDNKFCGNCNAPLPRVFKEVTEYVEIEGQGGLEFLEDYSNINKLRELVLGFLEEKVGSEEVIVFLESFQALNNKVIRQLEGLAGVKRELPPQVKDNIAQARFKMNEFYEAINYLLNLIKKHSLDEIKAQIGFIQSLGYELGEIRQNFLRLKEELA
ncbi:MAG: zinc ribbon domain-containing protein [Armatimonadetes bacterium]|nr:zinc ribbon domain-containing protein [Armatimonadota bacterium]